MPSSVPTLPGIGDGKSMTQGLSPIQIRALAKVFAHADLDFDGKVDRDELGLLLEEMGYSASEANVQSIMELLDVDGDGVITQEEFIAGSSTTHNIVAAAPKSHTNPQSTKASPRGQRSMNMSKTMSGSLDPDLKAFFETSNINEPWAMNYCAEDGITLKELIQLSNDPHDINYFLAEAGFSNETKRRIVRNICNQRNTACYHSKQTAIIVSIAHYKHDLVCSPVGFQEDGERMVDALTSQGFGVHYLNLLSEDKGSYPTSENILLHLRAVGAALTTFDGCADRSVLVYIMGNGIVDDNGVVFLMPYDFDPKEPISEGMSLSAIMGLIPPAANACYMADFAHMYQYKAGSKPEYTFTNDSECVLALSAIDLYRFKPPRIGGGHLTHHLIKAFATENLRADQIESTLKKEFEVVLAPQSGRLRGREFDTCQLIKKAMDPGSKKHDVILWCVTNGLVAEAPDQQIQSMCQGLSQRCTSTEFVALEYTNRLGITLQGVLQSSMTPYGEWNKVHAQINSLIGQSDTKYEVKKGFNEGEWVLLVSLGFETHMRAAQGGDDVKNVDVKSNNRRKPMGGPKSKGPGKPGPKKPGPKSINKPKPKAAAAPEPEPAKDVDPNAPSAEQQKVNNRLMEVVNTIKQKINEDGISLGGLKVVSAGLYMEVTVSCSAKDALQMEYLVKKGQMPESRIVTLRIDPRRTEPNSGIISHSGADIYSSMMAAYSQAASDSMNSLFYKEPSQVPPPERIVLHGTRVGDAAELAAKFKECRAGDIMEITGTWKAPITLERTGVTLRGDGNTIITNQGHNGPALCLRGPCRIEGIKIVSVNEFPACEIQFGAPEVLRCHITSKKGVGIKCSPLVDPYCEEVVVEGCGKSGMTIDGCTGMYKDCTFKNNHMGITISSSSMLNGPVIWGCTVTENSGTGVILENGSVARLRATTVSKNKTPGIILEKDAYGYIWQSHILQNDSCGIRIQEYSGCRVEDTEISGNVENEIIIDRANTKPVILNRNRFFKNSQIRKAAEVAIDLTNSKPLILSNDFEGYRVCLLVRGACRETRFQLNRSSPMKDPDALLIRDSSKYDNVEKQNVQFNEFYKGNVIEPMHLSNRSLPISAYSLLEATNAGYCAVVKRLIHDGSNPNIEGKDNPLLNAARAESLSMVELLLSSRADPNMQDGSGWTALHCAMASAHLPMAKMLLEYGANCHTKARDGSTAITVALDYGNIAGMRLLIRPTPRKVSEFTTTKVDPKKVEADATVASGHTVLATAARLSNIDAMKLLVECQADVNKGCESNNETPVFVAAQHSCVDALKWLLEKGGSPHAQTLDGNNPLLIGIQGGTPEVMATLLESKADVNQKTALRHITPAHMASGQIGNKKVLEVLIKQKADLNAQTKEGRTPLHYAAIHENHDIAKLLVDSGADKTLKDMHGATAQNYATGDTYTMLADKREEDILMWARSTEYRNIFEKTLKHASPEEVNRVSHSGITPFYQAVLFGNRSAASFLQEKSADGNCSNKENVSAYVWATYCGGDAMHKMLESYCIKKKGRDAECLTRLKDAADSGPENAEIVKMTLAFCMRVQASCPAGRYMNPSFPYSLENVNWLKTRIKQCLDSVSYMGVTKYNFKGTDGTVFEYLESSKIYAKPPISEMDQILWDARYLVMNRICNGDQTPAVNQLVLSLYTQPSELYHQIFKALITGEPADLSLWSPYMKALEAALSELKSTPDGKVYMCADHLLEMPERTRSSMLPRFTIPFQPGTQINFTAPTWGTESMQIVQSMLPNECGTLFQIASKTGKNISDYSCHPKLAEVLFPAGTSFVISSVIQEGDQEYAAWRAKWIAVSGPSCCPAVVVDLQEV